MSFDVSATAYDRFMGRFSRPLAAEFLNLADLSSDARVLDVGCGPGALTTRLVEQVGADRVSAVDPSPSFVAAITERLPEIDVRRAAAERLPFLDDAFDAAFAQLVVHFMADPVGGIREMGRVTRSGGEVLACVWDQVGGGSPLGAFWSTVAQLDPGARTEAVLPGTREGHLVELFEAAGLSHVTPAALEVTVEFASFDEWWEPYTYGVGPVGDYVARLDAPGLEALRLRCSERLPPPPFEITATAWAVRAVV